MVHFQVRASQDAMQLSKCWTIILREKDVVVNGGSLHLEAWQYSKIFEISKYHRRRLLELLSTDDLVEVFRSPTLVPNDYPRFPDSQLKRVHPRLELFYLCLPFIRWTEFQRVEAGNLTLG